MRLQLVVSFLLLSCFHFAQTLEEMEENLNYTLLRLRSSKTDQEIKERNEAFKDSLRTFLSQEGAFDYTFKHCETIAVLDSPDELVRVITWNLEFTDFTYSYGGVVMYKDERSEQIYLHELVDALDPYTEKPEGVVSGKEWYGALYYKLLPFEKRGKTEYILLGWDGGTPSSNMKLIDVLSVSKSNVKFGSPVFKEKKKTSRRVVFEYSEQAKMSLRYDEARKRIVFDHLSPQSPSLSEIPAYYVPDMSYDAYKEEDGFWYLQSDVIAVNDGDQKKDRKYWIDPSDKSEKGIKHVARTPESEENLQEQNMDLMPKKRRIRKRDDPNRLMITTGKYKSKGRKKYKSINFN